MLSEPLVGEGEGEDEEEEDGMPVSTRTSSNPLKDVQSDHLALIIDGPALARVFGDWEMERLLLRVATLCKSVVACRVSPAQKRMLIRLVKKGVKHPTPITLAIGDGANDVSGWFSRVAHIHIEDLLLLEQFLFSLHYLLTPPSFPSFYLPTLLHRWP